MEPAYYAAFCSVAPNFAEERDAEIARSSGGYEASFTGAVAFDQLRAESCTEESKETGITQHTVQGEARESEAALQHALSQAAGVDWSRRLESVLQRPSESAFEKLLRSIELHQLTSDFEAVCTVLASEIVSQLAKPAALWRLAPADTVGGIAGGQKFVVGNIFFKFARDSGIYGGDEGACKAAKHELRSLRQLLTTNTNGLAFPLMCTVDLAGFRLVCVSKLPISDATLVYGSADAGRTVHARDPEMNRLMISACSALGLGPHNVGGARVDENNQVAHDAITMWGPIDIEGHSIVSSVDTSVGIGAASSGAASPASLADGHSAGHNTSRYVLDVARLFPPMALSSIPNLTRFGLVAYAVGELEPSHYLASNTGRYRHAGFSSIVHDEELSPNATVEQTVQRFLLLQLPLLAKNKLCEELGRNTDCLREATADATTAGWVPCQVAHTQCGALYAFDQAALRRIAASLQADTQGLSESEANSAVSALGQNEVASELLGFPVSGPVVLAKDTGAVFFKLLRPEALAASPIALSSDAFTSFGCCTLCASGECLHGSRAEHLKVAAVTNHLVERTLFTMAQDIVRGSLLFPDGKSLTREMHARGLNLSLMGYLLKAFNDAWAPNRNRPAQEWIDTWVRQVIHIEMVARVLRSMLNERLRESVRSTEAAGAGQSTGAVAPPSTAQKLVLQFVVDAFLLPPIESGKPAPEAPAFWREVEFRGKLKFSSWAMVSQWDSGEVKYCNRESFLAYSVPVGILMTRFCEVSQVQETHPVVQSLLELCVGLRKGEADAASAHAAAQRIVHTESAAGSPPLVARTKSMFGADLLEQSLVAYLRSLDGQPVSERDAAAFPFVTQPPSERLLCGVLHCFRCSDTVQTLCDLVPHLCPRRSVWDVTASPASEVCVSTAAAHDIYSVRLMQLTQEACRKRNLDILSKWGPAVGKCINSDVPLTVQACSVLSVHGQCLEVLGQTSLAIQAIRRGLKFMQRFMPTHPILGQLSCNLARSLLSSARADHRAIAALALDDAFSVFNKLYGSLSPQTATQSDIGAAHSITAVDVLISVLLMGMADKVGVHLGGLLETLDSLAGTAQSGSQRTRKTLRQLQGAPQKYDGRNTFSYYVQRAANEVADSSDEHSSAQVGAPDVPAEAVPPSGTLQLSRSDSTALAALDDIDARGAAGRSAEESVGDALSQTQHEAVLRCIGRSTACMHMLEEFLGAPRDYFRGQATAGSVAPSSPLAELQRPRDLLSPQEMLSAIHKMYGKSAETSEPVAFLFGEQRRTAGSACSTCIVVPGESPISVDEISVTLRGAVGTVQAAVRSTEQHNIFVAQCIPYIAGEYTLHVAAADRAIPVQSDWCQVLPEDELAPSDEQRLHGQAAATIAVVATQVDAGCCSFAMKQTVDRGQTFFARLTLRDTFGNRRQRVSDAPRVRFSASGTFSSSCACVPCFQQDLGSAAEAADGGLRVPVFSLRRGSAQDSVPVPATLGCDWICAAVPDTLVNSMTCCWHYAAAQYEVHGETHVKVEIPQTNDTSSIWCNRPIPNHLLAGATPAKVCVSCAQAYGRKCLRCGKDCFFNARRVHVCQTCSVHAGMRSACARCGNALHFPASNVDAVECQTCSRGTSLKCVARK